MGLNRRDEARNRDFNALLAKLIRLDRHSRPGVKQNRF
jgi:hypothetical protein